MTLVRPGLQKRAAYRGIFRMDCNVARGACQNACWFTNCVLKRNNVPNSDMYTNGNPGSGDEAKNRRESGVTITNGTPCRHWPFGQKFWDTFPVGVRLARSPRIYSRGCLTISQRAATAGGEIFTSGSLDLGTDEWPMASFVSQVFSWYLLVASGLSKPYKRRVSQPRRPTRSCLRI